MSVSKRSHAPESSRPLSPVAGAELARRALRTSCSVSDASNELRAVHVRQPGPSFRKGALVVLFGAMISTWTLPSSMARAQSCEPACREGYACIDGACISPCNPACAAGEYCRADGQCLPVEQATRRASSAAPEEVTRRGRRRGIATVVGAGLYLGLMSAAGRAEARDSHTESECENAEVMTSPIYDCLSSVERDLYLPELPLLGVATLTLASFWGSSLRAGIFSNRNGYPGSRALRIVGLLGFALTAAGNVTLGAILALEPTERAPTHFYYLSAGLGALALVAAAADALIGARQARFEPHDTWSVQIAPLRDGVALAFRSEFP